MPPHHRIVRCFDEVVEPGLPDLRRRQIAAVAVIRQRTQKGKRARNIVVGDDQRHIALLVDVVVDLPHRSMMCS